MTVHDCITWRCRSWRHGNAGFAGSDRALSRMEIREMNHTAEDEFAYVRDTLEELCAAHAANNAAGVAYWSSQFAGVAGGLVRALSRDVLCPQTDVTSLQSKEACVHQSKEPLGDEAIVVLMVIANGLAHALAIKLFREWLATADVSNLTLVEIRRHFEQAQPGRYLPKSVIARLLAEVGRSYRS
jgi:hypothetical protein